MTESFNRSALLDHLHLDEGQHEDDQRVAFELINGHLTLRGHTWDLPVHPHWSADPFEDPEWRAEYQSLAWLAPLRRRALLGDDDARQAWWWLAASWLESLDRLQPGEATPWRPRVAAVRACELVAGLLVVGGQPWLVRAISTHRSWFQSYAHSAVSSERSEASIITVPAEITAALYACYRAFGERELAKAAASSLMAWRADYFSPVGVPYPDAKMISSGAAATLETVEACLTAVGAPSPWPSHDTRFVDALNSSEPARVGRVGPNTHSASKQEYGAWVVETDQAAFAGEDTGSGGGGFAGFENSILGPGIEVTFAHGGAVWLRGTAMQSANIVDPGARFTVRRTLDWFDIDAVPGSSVGNGASQRLVYSPARGVSVWDAYGEHSFDLSDWIKSVDLAPGVTSVLSGNAVRVIGGDQKYFLIKLPIPGAQKEDQSDSRSTASFRLYVGPWHTRLVDLLHQLGPRTAQLSAVRLTLIAGPLDTDDDLRHIYSGSGWRVFASRRVLRVDQSSVPGNGRLVLSTADGRTVQTGRTSRVARGYLEISDLPDGEYKVEWVPVGGRPRRTPNFVFTRDSVIPAR